jgi:hypothetical protein
VKFRVAEVSPWYTSAFSCADGVNQIWEETLGRMSVPAGANQHLVVVGPTGAYYQGCYMGLATMNRASTYPNLVWVSDASQSVYAHELGHNLGLHHSGALHCDAQDPAFTRNAITNRPVWPSNCYREEYGDLLDVMGHSGSGYGEGNLNAVHVERLGNTPSAVQTMTEEGSHQVRIAPLSADVRSLRVVEIVDPAGNSYYVEYRTNTGRDTAAAHVGTALGVRVLRQNPERLSSSSFVLDATPTGPSKLDAGGYYLHDTQNNLAAGATFTSAAGLVRIRVDSEDSSGASLTIVNGSPTTVSLTPDKVALSGLPSRVYVGSAVTATARIATPDDKPVTGWDVHLQRMLQGGTAYETIRTVRTDSSGVAAYRFVHTTGASYRYVTAEQPGAPAMISNAVSVTSQARVAMRKPSTSVRRNAYLPTSATISSVPSPVVYLQVRKSGGKWSTVRASVRGTGVSTKVRLTKAGTYQVRYYLASDRSGRYLGGYSPAYSVQVR